MYTPRHKRLLAAMAGLWVSATWAQAAPAVDLSAPLSLPDAVRLGVQNNLDLLTERSALAREESRMRGTWETYSPTVQLGAGLDYGRLRTPRYLLAYTAGISWRSPLGTVVSAGTTLGQPVNLPGESLNGAATVSVTQPLLKDGWLTGGAQPLREADLGAAMQRQRFRAALNATILDLETAYWDLAVAEADVEIKTRSRGRAQQQFEDTAENIRRGILADVELYVPQENVVFFEQELRLAHQNLIFARRRLAELLAVDPETPLRPAEVLAAPEMTAPPVAEVLDVGLRANPQLAVQRLAFELAATRSRYAANQALPTLNLQAALTAVGPSAPAGDAWLPRASHEGQLGLILALPLDRGAVDANVKTATYEQRRQEELVSREAQRVRFAILDGVTSLKTLLELLELTEQQVKLADLKLQAENEKYKSGISTLTDVVRFQRDLDNASIGLRRVIRSVQVERARLLAAQGTLHDAYGIELK